MIKYQYGIEIEFTSEDYISLLNKLKDFNCLIKFNPTYSDSVNLILKPELSVENGCELNIPPNFDRLQELCNTIKNDVIFTSNCALHIHIDATNIDCDKLYNYYANNEELIIQEAGDLYINLNKSITVKSFGRNHNMEIPRAKERHNTVEHRIYKATLDYDKIMKAVNQTLDIIEKSQN